MRRFGMIFAEQSGKWRFHSYFDDLPMTQWKIPLVVSISIHLVTFLSIVLSGSFFNFRKDVETYKVTLFSVEEAGPAAPATPVKAESKKPEPPKIKAEQPPPPPPPTIAEQPKKIAVPIPQPEPPKVVSTPEPREVISIEPAKTKAKKEPDKIKKEVLDDKLQRSLQRLNSKVAEEKALREAERQVAKALDSLRQTLQPPQQSPAATTSTAADSTATGRNAGPSGGKVVSEAKRRYYAALVTHISQFWQLPESQKWDPELESQVVVVISGDGSIRKSFFEKKSDNMYFDKFVRQSLESASPLPPIPPELNESELEIGFRFKPGELF